MQFLMTYIAMTRWTPVQYGGATSSHLGSTTQKHMRDITIYIQALRQARHEHVLIHKNGEGHQNR